MSAITVLRDLVYNGKTKHIDVRLKRVRELVQSAVVTLAYCPTERQLADFLTKGLSRDQFRMLRSRAMDDPQSHINAPDKTSDPVLELAREE